MTHVTYNCFFTLGIEDHIVKTKGYCLLVTDEGLGFFEDLKKKERNNETDLGLLNQLFDGKGDKTTLAKNNQRCVPRNATCMSICCQQQAFISGLLGMGKSMWLDNGFGECFILCAV